MTLDYQNIGTSKSSPRILGRTQRFRSEVFTEEAADWLASTSGEFNLYEFDPEEVQAPALITKFLGSGLTLLAIDGGFAARVIISPSDQTTLEPAIYYWSIDLTSGNGVFEQISKGKFQFKQGGA